jgi:hypothetical protein
MESAIEITEYFRATALKVYRQIFGETKYGKLEKRRYSSLVIKKYQFNQKANSRRSTSEQQIAA